MAGIVREKYTYTINTQKEGSPENSVRIYALDAVDKKIIDQKTNSGTIGEKEVLAIEYTITGTDTVASAVKNPHDIRALKYGNKIFQISKNVIQSAVDTFFLETNLNTSYLTSAAAVSATGIKVNHDDQLIKIIEDYNIGQIYDYMQVEDITNPQPSAAEIFSTNDSVTYNCIYDFLVSGASIDATGKTLFMPLNTFALSAGGQFSGKVTDINGTRVSLTLTQLASGTEVRVLSAGTTLELAGVENSGTEFSWLYTHKVDFDVDIVIHNLDYLYQRLTNVTLTNNGAVIPIQQQIDRWYNNP